MPTDKQIDAATDAYLTARGWNADMIRSHTMTRSETRDRIEAALRAAEQVADVQNTG